ncbi:hypothetical protein ACN2XU_02220 [Primorskyibacter sp. 2E107]
MKRASYGIETAVPVAGEQVLLARLLTYLRFFSPSETGFTAPEFAVARVLGFSCFGFFASLFPRLLLPFPIMTSQVKNRSGDMPDGPILRKIRVA